MVKTLDDALYHFGSQLISDTGINIMETPGSGAAGGIGGGMLGFLNAKLKPGVEIVLDTLDFDKSLKNIDTEDQSKIEEMLKKSNGARTIPQIFIGSHHVGGNLELQALEHEGKLDNLVKN